MKLRGNGILITGGATGIGYSMAKYFLEKGNEVLICGRRADRLEQAAQGLDGVKTLQCDVADQAGRVALFDYVKNHFPQMNVLINNAGIQRDIDLTKGLEDLDGGDDEIKINLEGPVYLSALFTPFLAEKEDAVIIHVSSGLAFMPDRAFGMPVYTATKAALHNFAIAQRVQLAPLGIQVVEIIPPAVQSELNLLSRERRGGQAHMMATDAFTEMVMEKLELGEAEIRVTQ